MTTSDRDIHRAPVRRADGTIDVEHYLRAGERARSLALREMATGLARAVSVRRAGAGAPFADPRRRPDPA